MKYFLANHSLRRAETGTDQQTEPLASGLTGADLQKPDSLLKLPFGYFPDFKPKVYFELQEKGRFTDVVRVHNTKTKGFLVNQKFIDFLQSLNIMKFETYEGVLFQKQDIRQFFIFHMAALEVEGLDFQKSTFKDDYDEKYNIKLNRLIDKCNYRGIYLNMDKIYFGPTFKNYDMFFIPYFQVCDDFFVSEKFVLEYKKTNLTGLKFTEQNVIEEW